MNCRRPAPDLRGVRKGLTKKIWNGCIQFLFEVFLLTTSAPSGKNTESTTEKTI